MNESVLMQSNVVRRSADGGFTIMGQKIAEWLSMYQNSTTIHYTDRNGVEHKRDTLGLPASISAEFARLVTQELEISIVDPKEKTEAKTDNKSIKNETRASFLARQISKFTEKLPVYTEYACAGGGVVFKPYLTMNNEIAIDCSLADEFVPLSFNAEGKITKCAFSEDKQIDNKFYHRIETHTFEKDKYIVTNEAYRSTEKNSLGKKCSLAEVPEWNELSENTSIENVKCPLFAYFRIPIGNCIDTTSPLGMSAFSRAIPQILEADKQWENYLWEFESSQSMVEVARGTFATDKNGDPIVPQGKERLFIVSQIEIDEDSNNFKTYSPQIREQAIKAGLNTILQRIEFNCGLAYGTLSDPSQIEKTAEEIKTSRQRSYSTVHHIQSALDDAINDLICAIDTYATLYNLAPSGDYEVKTLWDDSIIIDAEKERLRDKDDVRQGIMKKWEYRVKWYNESEEVAKAICGEEVPAENPFDFNK